MNIGIDLSRIFYLGDDVKRLVLAMLLTISSELLAFVVLMSWQIPKRLWLIWMVFIIGINCLSNPLAQIIYTAFIDLNVGANASWLLSEMIIIVIEALFIFWIMHQTIKMAFVYSVLLNLTSILTGEILCWVNLLPWCYV